MNNQVPETSALVKLGDRFSRPLTVLALLMVLLGIGFALGRAYNDYSGQKTKFDWEARGLSDLHTCYLYSKTFRYGLSPYEVQERADLAVPRPSAPFLSLIHI